MTFEIKYPPDVKKVDIPLIDLRIKNRIKKAIETRLIIALQQYGEPLRKNLKGYWKLRVGDYRVVFTIVVAEVWLLGIVHRKNVYERVKKKTSLRLTDTRMPLCSTLRNNTFTLNHS